MHHGAVNLGILEEEINFAYVFFALKFDKIIAILLKLFKQIDARYSCATKKLDALTSAGFELEEIVQIALQVG